MTREEAAALLNGNEYANEGTRELWAQMKEAGLVAVFGASDDLTEFRGAIYDEAGAGEETDHRLTQKGLLESECGEGDDCPYFERFAKSVPVAVKARWCPPGFDGSWLIETPLPHATFDITEDGEVYCRGVVVSVADLPGHPLTQGMEA
jgi:hypothetical protein